MNVPDFLDLQGVPYRLSHHRTTYTSQDLAQVEHMPGRKVIKPVIVDADGKFLICALPASQKVNLSELKAELRARDVKLVEENMLAELFPGCELGAEPPIGNMYGIGTMIDASLLNADEIMFQAGTHTDAVTMRMADYKRVANPQVGHFSS